MGNTHAPYTKAEKDAVLARLLPPASESVAVVSNETGISIPTLKKWLEDAQAETLREEGDGAKLSVDQKFQVVLETAMLDENALEEYAREHGLCAQNIKEWIQNARFSNNSGASTLEKYKEAKAGKKETEKQAKALKQELANLKKDIDAKNKMIAEQEAIINLQKKIWNLNS